MNQIEKALKIRDDIAKEYGLSLKDLVGNSPARKFTRARYNAWARTRAETDLTLKEIGELYNRTESTVLVGLKKV